MKEWYFRTDMVGRPPRGIIEKILMQQKNQKVHNWGQERLPNKWTFPGCITFFPIIVFRLIKLKQKGEELKIQTE